jgi:hypothetical protein|tara:strand:- start:321 stop:779 length:459 start_codon:yes stop_codon:yes gene_type:complete
VSFEENESSQTDFFFNFVKISIMIQRIQTLYLFVAAILSALSAFVLPMYSLDEITLEATANAATFGGFGGSMAFFSGAILLYRNLKLQLLIVRLSMVLSLLVLGALIWIIQGNGGSAALGVVIPFVNIVLAFMASKGIQKDEAKLRSLDRLR